MCDALHETDNVLWLDGLALQQAVDLTAVEDRIDQTQSRPYLPCRFRRRVSPPAVFTRRRNGQLWNGSSIRDGRFAWHGLLLSLHCYIKATPHDKIHFLALYIST